MQIFIISIKHQNEKIFFSAFILFLLNINAYSQSNNPGRVMLKKLQFSLEWLSREKSPDLLTGFQKDSVTGESESFYYIGGTSNMLGYINKLRIRILSCLTEAMTSGNSHFQYYKRKLADRTFKPVRTWCICHRKSWIWLRTVFTWLCAYESKLDYLFCKCFLKQNKTFGKPFVIKKKSMV